MTDLSRQMPLVDIRLRPYQPAPNTVFELELKPIPGMEMLANTCSTFGWRFLGEEVTTQLSGRFKLVQLVDFRNFYDLVHKLEKLGQVPQGQWRDAYQARFQEKDGDPYVAVADDSWLDPSGHRRFPYATNHGSAQFMDTCEVRRCGYPWLWLVRVQPGK